ncbi:hypothetical protein [uncultured Tissierella sp.]|uniref:hypothetical protein n=1 Tax=uncultured Tissierella sp. TaxID=448160 RepID=UPI002805F51F|nr:hypothetical protein [uncultured Tissierella sp.]MDU5080218.1 hypothetical protein [Bacillota bacterium]
MAKYIYKKYLAVSSTRYEEAPWVQITTDGKVNTGYILTGASSYSFNTSTGKFSVSGSTSIGRNSPGTIYALHNSNAVGIRRTTISVSGDTAYLNTWDKERTASTTYSRGSFIEEIVAEDGAYPSNGRSGSYWYVKGGLANSPPTIDGIDSNLGDKNLGFMISYEVDDVDSADSLIVTEKLNGSIIKTINGAPRNQPLEIKITNKTLFSLPLNSKNTIEIKVDDQNGGIAYRRYTFRRTNTAPVISDEDQDIGQKIEPFSVEFNATDNEGNSLTVKTYLNGIKKEEYQVGDGATNTFTISSEDWYKLGIGTHSIKIEAIDEHGATAIRNYTFTRYDDKIQFTLKNVIETDIAATKILVTPTWVIPIGATAKVEVCNNGYDEIPTWEDITSQVITGKHYIFTNDTKTADKWGIDIRFTIEKGTAIEECVIHGFGGAFE